MGWAMQRRPRQCQLLALELRRYGKIRHIIFRALVTLKPLVSLICSFVACSSRINVDRQIKYRNPRCACTPRVNKHRPLLSLFMGVPGAKCTCMCKGCYPTLLTFVSSMELKLWTLFTDMHYWVEFHLVGKLSSNPPILLRSMYVCVRRNVRPFRSVRR